MHAPTELEGSFARESTMEPISALVAIVAAGASAALSEVATDAVKSAYAGVKAILADKLRSFSGLESAPKDEAKKQEVVEEMKQTAANDDPEVIDKIRELEAALRSTPPDVLQKSGVSITDVNAAHDVLIKDVKYGKYFNVQRVTSAQGKIEITGISGGGDTEKK
jgi:hypothetical protein